VSNQNKGWNGSDWKRWQTDLVEEGSVKAPLPDRFARCACGTVEHLLMGEIADRFRCCECRADRVETVIAARIRKAA
jgi:hypothetical protein